MYHLIKIYSYFPNFQEKRFISKTFSIFLEKTEILTSTFKFKSISKVIPIKALNTFNNNAQWIKLHFVTFFLKKKYIL